MQKSPALIVRDVSVTYRIYEDNAGRATLKGALARARHRRRPRLVEAVRGVSFDLREGEALGLIGPNGSGKSSLLRAVAGLMPIVGGSVFARSEPLLLGVGAALHPDLSGRRNVYLGGTALGLTTEDVASRFDEIVDFAGVREFIDMPLRAFSSGMAARLRFAIASAVQPDILLIDEALAVGDREFITRSERRIRALLKNAGAIILVSHNPTKVTNLCSRAIWLEGGVIVTDGPASEVVAAYQREVDRRGDA